LKCERVNTETTAMLTVGSVQGFRVLSAAVAENCHWLKLHAG
jgi:hypothetical protein